MRVRALVLLVFIAAGCGAAPPNGPVVAASTGGEVEEQPAAPPLSEGTIARAELDLVLDQGLGRFLQSLVTAPHLDEGRFVGHRVTEIRSELLRGVDLRPGDTLLRINGLPIERPEQALAAWTGLRVASELTVDYLREGEERQIRFTIAD